MKPSGRRRTAPVAQPGVLAVDEVQPAPLGVAVAAPPAKRARGPRGPRRAAPGAGALAPHAALVRMLAAASDAVTVFDRDWRIVFINQRSADLLGMSREELTGRVLWDFYPAAAAGLAYDQFHRAMREQVSLVFELFSPNVGRVLQCTALPTPDGLIAISRDVERVPTPASGQLALDFAPSVQPVVVGALQRSERRFRALIENSNDAVMMVDVRGRMLYASPRVFGPDGILPVNGLGHELVAHLHPEDAERARADFRRLRTTPDFTVHDSYRICHRDGGWRWIEGTAQNRLHDPAVGAIVINCRDVTDRRDAEAAYRSLVDHSFQGQLIARNGRIVFANPTLEQITGYSAEELCSFTFEQLLAMVHVEDRAATICAFADPAALDAGSPVLVWRYQRRDGALRWVECRVASFEYRGEPAVQVSLLDTTEKRRAEEALRFSEQHFRSLIEGALDLVTVIDENGRIVYASPSHQRVLGWTPEEIHGRGILGLIHPDDREQLTRDFEIAVAGAPSSRVLESRVRHKDGSWRIIESATHRSPTASPVGGYIVNARDVTERKAAEHKTSVLLALARDLASTLDAGELLQKVGRHVASALQCDLVSTQQWSESEQRYRMDFHHGTPPEGLAEMIPSAAAKAFIAQLADGPATFDDSATGSGLRHTIMQRHGVKHFVAAPLRTSARYHGALIAATTHDRQRYDATHAELLAAIAGQVAVVLERAELHRRQQEDAQVFGALARVGQELLAGFDLPDLPDRLCDVTAEVLGCGAAYTLAWHRDDDTCSVVAARGTTRETLEALRVLRIPKRIVPEMLGAPASREARLITADGCELAAILGIQTSATMLQVPLMRGDEPIGLQIAIRDASADGFSGAHLMIATGLARLGTLALDHARTMDELGRANRLKSDFVAMISHELRTPLNVILGYSDLLLEETFGTLHPSQLEVLRGIHASGRDLLRLIRDVLDLSRLESGRMPLDLKEVAVPELIAELATEARALERPGEVELAVRIEGAPGALLTDPAKVAVVLKNLLANAFKFTPRGTVTLAARPHDGGITFAVEDTGIGIPAEHQSIIFEPFRQGDPALTRRHGGVGLGLYIVRRLVETLGGSVQVDSEPGRGARFQVWLPGEACHDRGEHDGTASSRGAGDTPTGLPSSTLLRDRLAQAMATGDPQQVVAAVLFVNLDFADAPSARASRATRDALLCMVGERLGSVLRMTDTVSHLGGDDFVVLLPGRTTDHAIEDLSRLLLDTLSVDFLVDGEPNRLAATVGAVLAHGGRGDAETIIDRARRAALDAQRTRLRTAIVHVRPPVRRLQAPSRVRPSRASQLPRG